MSSHPQYLRDRARRDEKARVRFETIRTESLMAASLPAMRRPVPGLRPGDVRALLFVDDHKLYVAHVGESIGRRFSTRRVLAIFRTDGGYEIWTEDRHHVLGAPIVIADAAAVEVVPFAVHAASAVG
jgi:plasmid stabilization system protein ParE